jgi:hypothetical protein
LGLIYAPQIRLRFDLHDNTFMNKEVRLIVLFETSAFVLQGDSGLRLVGDTAKFELDLESLLIDRLKMSGTGIL